MKTGILTFEQYHGKKEIGSSRIRGHWIVKHWQEAGNDIGECEIFRYGAHYDVVIYQKAYFVKHAHAFKGVKILDICDPDWLSWTGSVVEMIQEVDAITCSSKELCKAIQGFTDKPVYFVPDRVNIEGLPAPKVQEGPTKTAVWYGYSQNFPILDSAIKALLDHKLDLIVVSDEVYIPPAAFPIKVLNLPWSIHHQTDIQQGDIVINPRYTKGKWKFKSDNKKVIAWGLGMPVAEVEKDLDRMMTAEGRIEEAKKGMEIVLKEYKVQDSVVDYKDIIEEVLQSKNAKNF